MKTYKFYFLFLAMLLTMPMTVSAENEERTHPSGVVVSPSLNIDSLIQVAEQGDAEAQKNLGFEYGLEKKYTEAAKWYLKAAEQGDAEAQKELGDLYFYKDYGQQNYAEAAKWYGKAAEQGESGAQERLGYLYAKGKGVKQDYAEAAKWYRKAAEQGYTSAQEDLGDLYAEGKGVKQDYTEAAKWYQKAANDEFFGGFAQEKLGNLYAEGKGVKQDYAEAAKWYSKAAEQYSTAQIKLGICYATGKGVEQNLSKATSLIFKGLKEPLGLSRFLAVIMVILLIPIILAIFIYKKYRKEGFKKSQAIIILFILLLGLIPTMLFAFLIGFLTKSVGLSLLDYGDYFKLACVPIALLLICSFIIMLLTKQWKKSPKTSSISSECENDTSEDTLIDGKKGHKIKINIATGHIISLAVGALAFLVGILYYWFVTKALGHEPLSRLTDLVNSGSREEATSIIINLLILIVALILGLMVMPLLHRLVWGWRNTSSRMDWKNMVIATYCNKPLKKSQYIKGAIAPFFILGLLPLLVSPFVNSIGMCLFGIVFIGTTAPNFMYVWKLRKEPRDCMIQDIKGEYACFVLDKEQPTDNE